MRNMTSRERMLASINSQPVDRLAFWPKVFKEYVDYNGKGQFEGWTIEDFHNYFDSDLHVYASSNIKLVPACKSQTNTTTEGDATVKSYELNGEKRMVIYREGHPVSFPIENAEDILFMTKWYENTEYCLDTEGLEKQKEQLNEVGDKGIIVVTFGRSPLMNNIEILTGVENTQFLLMDHQEEMEALFNAMQDDLIRIINKTLESSVADMFYMIEDTSTMLISPSQYRKYCKKHILEYKEICEKNSKILTLHMCGHLYDLLSDLGEMNMKVFEAFTTPTVGNTHLIDGRKHCPNTCLIGGTNAALWLRPVDEIISGIKAELDALPHHRGIIVTSAGVMPPACKPETIKRVGEFVKSYRVKV